MNLPNKLTMLRLVMIPFILWMIYIENSYAKIIGIILLILAMISDFLDGHIARKKNTETFFGKFLDPVVDKILMISILFTYSDLNFIPLWLPLVYMAREIAITGFRSAASVKGVIIGANWMGKTKTWIQTISIIIVMFLQFLNTFPTLQSKINPLMRPVSIILLGLSVLVALAFFANFLYWNRKLVFKDI